MLSSFFPFSAFPAADCVDFENSHDNSLARLVVQPWDNWKGINPVGGVDFNPDPPIFAAKFSNSANYTHILALSNEEGRVSLECC